MMIRGRVGKCETCEHYGCCDNLHHCGGGAWVDAYVDCAQCGHSVLREDAEFFDKDGHVFCSEECLDQWLDENGIDDDEGA